MARAYKRDGRGRFAGGGSAVTTTYGRAGGFASKSLQGRAAVGRARSAASRRRKVVIRRNAPKAAGALGAALIAGAIAGSRSRVKSPGPGLVGRELLRSAQTIRRSLT